MSLVLGETTLQALLLVLEGIGVVAFALSGALAAVRKRVDVVGVIIIAFLTAMGGGTLRDVLLDRRPFFWVAQEFWIWVVIAVGLAAALILRARHFEPTHRAIQWPDAMGLGLFAASGTQIALELGHTPLIAALMGVVTSATGGLLRDVLLAEVPWVIASYQLYALLAFAGGWLVWGLGALGTSSIVAVTVGALAITGARILAIAVNLQLPNWRRNDHTGPITLL